ncbi:MAG: MFS transporter [Gammaproteobacteria bacterium]|nr:MFS transporter [Gammaproteobacteria bacterium]
MGPNRISAPDPAGVSFGPFWITPGITRGNAVVLLFSGFSLICLLTFMAFIQPYLLEEVLHIPKERQGSLTGMLGLIQEVIVIGLASFIGATSDKLGRRVVYVTGVCLFAAAYIIYPLAETEGQLYAFRIFYAVGFAAATVMLHVCLAEYSQEASRGRWLGMVGFMNGLGVVVMAFGLSRLPQWFVSQGYDSVQAVRFSYWTFAGYLFLLAALLRFGLAPGAARSPGRTSSLRVAAQGFRAARDNPRILLAYGMAFASRGDLAILTGFFSLWLVQAGTDLGLTAAESSVKAGRLFGLSQLCGLLWAYPIGIIIDRLPRMTAMCVAFGLATVGYFALGQIEDPFGRWIPFACILAGVGESSAMIAGGTLIGQEAPAKSRGAVLGTYSLMGAAGIMVLTFTGGILFDQVGRTAPFVMMGFINLAVLVGALWLRRADRRKAAAIGPPSDVQPGSG